jgi:predicted metal-dependent phosphotriesterase family hydrolase
MDFAIRELKRAREPGLRTLVDVGATNDGAGIREVSLATGVQVICCTGAYALTDHQQPPQVADFASHMVKDIEGGVQGTQLAA